MTGAHVAMAVLQVTLTTIVVLKTTSFTFIMFYALPQLICLAVFYYSWFTIRSEMKKRKIEKTFATEKIMLVFMILMTSSITM